MSLVNRLFKTFGSFGFAAVLLVFLLILTWLGTLEQVEFGLYEVQKKYFDSLFLVHWAGPFDLRVPFTDMAPLATIPAFPIPLPGVYLLLALLLFNLLIGGILRLKKDWRRTGILIAHVGIVMLLAAGFVKFKWSVEGNIALTPRDYLGRDPSFPRVAETDQVQSFTEWEVVIHEAVREGKVREHSILNKDWEGMRPGSQRRFTSDALPFDVAITRAFKNARVYPKGPMFEGDGPTIDGYVVVNQAPATEKSGMRNIPSLYVTFTEKVSGKQTDAILSAMQDQPLTLEAGAKQWIVDLRLQVFRLPFRIRLEKFTFETHPGTMQAKVFLSDVVKIENGEERALKITMNEPLRHEGWTLFQASYEPQDIPPSAPHYSIFQVVKNPSDQWPKWSCYVIAIGLLLHFGSKLLRYVKSEHRRVTQVLDSPPAQKVRPERTVA